MDIQQYKNDLDILDIYLEKFDGNIADTNNQELNAMFTQVHQSGLLQITHLAKETQNIFKLELFIHLSKHSGTLAFLIIQILAAHSIMRKNNYKKYSFYEEKRCGIAINHLRAVKTIVSAKKCAEGYLLNGKLTWASGYKIFDTLCIGFHYDDFEFEAMAPFKEQDGFTLIQTDDTFVGFGLNTVGIELNNFFVPFENIVSSNPKGNYIKNKAISKTVHFCLYGLGEAILDYLDKENQILLKKKLLLIKEKILISNNPQKLDQLRIDLFHLALHSVTNGMIQIGGKSILKSETLQRIYRELIMFNSNGLNLSIKKLFNTYYQKVLNND